MLKQIAKRLVGHKQVSWETMAGDLSIFALFHCRNKKGKRHPLVSILALIVIGLMIEPSSIATWALICRELPR